MSDDSLSPADKTALAFFEIVAFALGWGGVDRLLAGTSLLIVIPIFVATILTSYTGFKWPQIKLKLRPRFAATVARVAGSRRFQLVGVFIVGAILGGSTYRYICQMGYPKAAEQSPPVSIGSSSTESNLTGSHVSVTVTDENNFTLKGAEIYLIHRNGVHSSKTVTDNAGIANVPSSKEMVSVFCALDGFSSYYQKDYSPSGSLKIKLTKNSGGGSIVIADGTGYILGLSGRLNPILDSEGRTYLYAENIAIDGGKNQPVNFSLNNPMTLEDSNGHKVEIKIVSIIGSSSLIDYRRF